MGTAKRLGLLLMVMALVSLSLPVHIVEASGTTVEINNGNTITLGVDGSQSDIPVEIKGLPNLGAPANGLAAFQFDFSWDKNVITVDRLTTTVDAMLRGFTPTIGATCRAYALGCRLAVLHRNTLS